MIKKILVCLEGSLSTEAATRTAIEIARDVHASLVGLAIIDEPDIRAGTPVGIGGTSFKHERDEALVAEAQKNAADWVALFESRCRNAGVAAATLEVTGRPVDSILDEMSRCDLTVIGRDANFTFNADPENCETRDAILHRADKPVLIVPEGAADRPASKSVVIAYDGSGAARRAMSSFAASGMAQGKDVLVACVDDNGEEAYEIADSGVRNLAKLGVAAVPHNIVSALSNVDALFKFAEDSGAGLMVMGAFARSRIATFFKGSATHGIVERTKIPLYLQH
jgi:nucleotide-binding universal stress UspA family protein